MNILITSAGRRAQLVHAFQQQLAKAGAGEVFAADMTGCAPTIFIADRNFCVPPADSDQYVATLLRLSAEHRISLIVPTIDTELAVLAEAKSAFRDQGTEVAVSSPETISIAGNKVRTHQWLREHGYPTPSRLPHGPQGHVVIPARFEAIVKPAEGSRSLGTRRLPASSEARIEMVAGSDVVEEYVSGTEFTVSGYVDRRGRCVAAVPRERLEVRDGEVSKAVTRRNPRLERLVQEVLEQLPDAWGPLNVQVIRDSDTGEFRIIEVNARFGGGDPLAWAAGANAPQWLLDEVAGRPIGEPAWVDGLTMLRFDSAVYVNDQGVRFEAP